MADDDERDDGGAEARSEAKKERVLHTRVPAVLESELKKLATNLKVPVSNLVRAILEDAVDAVDAVGQKAEGELLGIAERMARQRDSLRSATISKPERETRAQANVPSTCPTQSDEMNDALGFQTIKLASDRACTVCGRELRKGTNACRVVRDGGGASVVLGVPCALVPEDDSQT